MRVSGTANTPRQKIKAIFYKMEKGYLTSVKSSKGNIFLASVPIYLWKPLK
jgi:hypothetical protein